MEWVETTGKTIEEAKDTALDQLGVDEQDAEFEVLEQPKVGLFGRVRSEGRVRARVKPTSPRPKEDRRDRKRRTRGTEQATSEGVTTGRATDLAVGAGSDDGSDRPAPRRRRNGSPADNGTAERGRLPVEASTGPGSSAAATVGSTIESPRRSPSDPQPPRRRAPRTDHQHNEGESTDVEVELAEQGRVAHEFLAGLLEQFGLSADVAISEPEEDTLELALSGEDLGILIGPKGATLIAIQDLTRTVVQRRTGATNGHIQVDVGGYRQKRTEALVRFAAKVAADVRASGQRAPLEPMSASDRRIVHDAVGRIDGVSTASEGEDARRHVVILPGDA